VKVTVVFLLGLTVVIRKVTDVVPAGMVTLDGGVAMAGLELCNVIRTPPAGAGADRVTVPVTVVPPVTVLGLTLSKVRAGGITVTVVLFSTPL